MSIAVTQERYLIEQNTPYELLSHEHSGSSHETAEAAHVAEDHIAKAVLLKDKAGYLLVVVPASNWLRLEALRDHLNRDLRLASEDELAALFDDCARGAVPPLGPAYGLETLLDASLASLADVYFEAGDHQQLVHLRGEDFQSLFGGARRGYYSHEH